MTSKNRSRAPASASSQLGKPGGGRSRRRLIPAADQLVILSGFFNAGQVVPQVQVPLARASNGREVFSQLISGERQVRVMEHIGHRPTVGTLSR